MIEQTVNSYSDIFNCLQKGTNNRRVCITQDNNRSSRSHTIFMLFLEQSMLDQTQALSRLCIVDLAGSEKLQSNLKNRMLETKNINTSLLTLAKCITHLSKSSDAKHVPFRESKLTRILKESLGGNSKTTLICAARFSDKFQEETIQTLRFAREAKKIQNNIQVKILYTEEQLLEQIEKLKQENAFLHRQLIELKKKYEIESSPINSVRNKTDSINEISNEGVSTLSKKNTKEINRNEPPLSHRSRNGTQKLKKQSSLIFDDNAIIKQHQELLDYKIRFDSLKKSSEDQIMKLTKEINSLNEKLSKTSNNKIQEIENMIYKLSSKYDQQEQEIKQEKQIIRDVQKVLAETQSSPKNMNDVDNNNTNHMIISKENDDINIKGACQLIECINNRIKVQRFEKLFQQFEKQYNKLFQENQMSRNLLQELSQKLRGGSLIDINGFIDSQTHITDDSFGSYLKDHQQNSDSSFDIDKEEKFMFDLNKEILEFQKQNKELSSDIRKYQQQVNNYNFSDLQNIKNPEHKQSSERKMSMSETFINLNLIDELKIGDNQYDDEHIRSPISSILPFENIASSRRGNKQKAALKGIIGSNQSHKYSVNGGDKTPQNSHRTWNGYDNTPQNKINQSYQSTSSKFSDLADSHFVDLDLSRIENSMYDDYEDESISENLYGTSRTSTMQFSENTGTVHSENKNKQNDKLHRGSSFNLSLKKQLFQEEEQENILLNMSDSRQPTKRINNQLNQSVNISQNNLSFNNENDNSQLKVSQSDIFSSRKNTSKSSTYKNYTKPQQIQVADQ